MLYLVLIAAALALAVAGAAQGFADANNVENYARRQWNLLSDDQTDIIQVDELCCNFDTLSPCCRFAAGTGECSNSFTCFEKVQDPLLDNFHLISVTCTLQAVYLFGVAICSVVLYKFVEMRPNMAKSGKKRRSMDFTERTQNDDDFFS